MLRIDVHFQRLHWKLELSSRKMRVGCFDMQFKDANRQFAKFYESTTRSGWPVLKRPRSFAPVPTKLPRVCPRRGTIVTSTSS